MPNTAQKESDVEWCKLCRIGWAARDSEGGEQPLSDPTDFKLTWFRNWDQRRRNRQKDTAGSRAKSSGLRCETNKRVDIGLFYLRTIPSLSELLWKMCRILDLKHTLSKALCSMTESHSLLNGSRFTGRISSQFLRNEAWMWMVANFRWEARWFLAGEMAVLEEEI
jgi:hypothetical protein